MDERMVGKVLRRAAELVRQGWTQGCGARDEQGQQCGIYDLRAASWCLGGAVNRAIVEFGNSPGTEFSSAVARALPIHAGAIWNDAPGRTAEEVAALLERAAGEP